MTYEEWKSTRFIEETDTMSMDNHVLHYVTDCYPCADVDYEVDEDLETMQISVKKLETRPMFGEVVNA